MVNLDALDYNVLSYFYDVFLKASSGKMKKDNSVFFQFIEFTSGNRAEILRQSAVNTDYEDFSPNNIDKLVEGNYIMRGECDNCFTLTAKGLFDIEEHRGLIDFEKFLEEIQTKYFGVFKGESKLNDREKTVVFSLICSRSFSVDSCMKIDSFSRENEVWMRIFRKCASLLLDLHMIAAIPQKLEEDVEGYEIPIIYIMRRMNHLQEKTRNIYNFNKNRCYFLGLDTKTGISASNLTFLLQKVFDKVLTLPELDRVKEFVNRISSEEIIHMSEHNGRKYSKPEVDLILERSIQEAIYGKL